MKKVLLAIAQPEYINPECYISIMAMWSHAKEAFPDISFSIGTANSVRTDLNRNFLVKQVYDDGFDAILHLDADMIYPRDMLEKYINHALGGMEVIGCLYFKRSKPYTPLMYRFSGNKKRWKFVVIDPRTVDRDVYPVDALATGGLFITKSAMDKLGEDKWFSYGANFHIPHEADEKEGHDLAYCAKLRHKGVDVWVDTTIRPDHISKLMVNESVWLEHISKYPEDDIMRHPTNTTIIFPTAKRPEQLRLMLKTLFDRTYTDSFNVYVIVEGKESVEVLQEFKNEGSPIDWVEVDSYQGYGRSINMGIRANPDSFYYAYLGDDVLVGVHWLDYAIDFMENSFPQKNGLVCFDDGKWNGTLACHGLISKNTIKEIGWNDGIFCPHYTHYNVDRELTEKAQQNGVYGYCPASTVFHMQAKTGLSDSDEITERATATWDEANYVYALRKKLDFNTNTFVPVIGIHRSGTSVVTGVLHMLGVDMGDDMIPPSEDNPKGHFEHIPFVSLNKAIFSDMNRQWYSPPSHKELEKYTDTYQNDICSYMRTRKSKVFGVKDPRLVDLYPLYEPVFDVMNTKPVVVTRLTESVEKSLNKRNPKLGKDFIKEQVADWETKLFNIRAGLGDNYFHLPYESLLEETEKVIDELIAWLGIDVAPNVKQKAINFVDKNLDHSK